MHQLEDREGGRSGQKESITASPVTSLAARSESPEENADPPAATAATTAPERDVATAHAAVTPGLTAAANSGSPAGSGDAANSGLPAGSSDVAAPIHIPLLVRYLDLVVLAVALPVFIAASLPLVAWGVVAGAWLVQRAVQIVINNRVQASRDPRTVVGLLAGSMMGRAFFVAISVFAVGVSDNSAGLAAAVLVIVLFTVYFTVGMVTRPLQAPPSRSRRPTERSVDRPPAAPSGPSADPSAGQPVVRSANDTWPAPAEPWSTGQPLAATGDQRTATPLAPAPGTTDQVAR